MAVPGCSTTTMKIVLCFWDIMIRGGYSLTSDHAVITGNYECISPEVTHEEDQGYYETYVDYYYCDCGATK